MLQTVSERARTLKGSFEEDAMGGFKATPINVPTLEEVTRMYQRAVAGQDATLRSLAEQAVNRLAAAEAFAAETATLVAFHEAVKK
jgi:hypothetical protein